MCPLMCQEKLGRGEFGHSANMRVLHLRMNPEASSLRQVRFLARRF